MFYFIGVRSLPWCGSVPEGCPCSGVDCPMGHGPSEILPTCSTPPKGSSPCSHSVPFHMPFPVSLSFSLLCLLPLAGAACSYTQVSWGVGSPGYSVGVGPSPWISEPLGAAHGLFPQRAPCSHLLPKCATLPPVQMRVLLLCEVKKNMPTLLFSLRPMDFAM